MLFNGAPYEAPRRVCIFEHDPGYPIWRHYEALYEGIPGMDIHQARHATELVVRMVATIGNYDYFQDYVFRQDGQLRIRLISTGIDAVKGVFSQSLPMRSQRMKPKPARLLPQTVLPLIMTIFSAIALIWMLMGKANNFSRYRLARRTPARRCASHRLWEVLPQRVTTERQAQTKMDVSKPALLVFSSENKNNAMGYPSAYQVMMPNINPLVPVQMLRSSVLISFRTICG